MASPRASGPRRPSGPATGPWVQCRDCVHFRPYAFTTEGAARRGHCAADARRRGLDRDRKRHCDDYSATPPPKRL